MAYDFGKFEYYNALVPHVVYHTDNLNYGSMDWSVGGIPGPVLHQQTTASGGATDWTQIFTDSSQANDVDVIKWESKPFTDAAHVASDPVFNAWVQTFTDGSTVTDTFDRLVVFARIFTDSSTANESLTKYTEKKIANVTASIVESLTKGPDKKQTDSVSSAESLTKATDKKISQAVTVAETFMRLVVAARLFTDTTTLSEAILKNPQKALSDSSTLTESLIKLSNIIRSFSESSTLTETIKKDLNKVLSDSTAPSETMNRLVSYFRNFLEQSTVQEDCVAGIIGGAVALSKILTDTMTVVETLQRDATYYRSFTDTSTVGELFNRLVAYVRNYTETKAVLDVLSRSAVFGRVFSDTSTITANLITREVAKILTAATSVSETTAKFLARLMVESLTITENSDKTKNFVREFIEGLALAETAAVGKAGLIIAQFLSPQGILTDDDMVKMKACFPQLVIDELMQMRGKLPEIPSGELDKMKLDMQRLLKDWR